MHDIETHGQVPALAGLPCKGLRSEGFIHEQVARQDVVLYLNDGKIWHRLVIDYGVVFWRQQMSEPQSWAVHAEGFEYPVRDIASQAGLIDLHFEKIEQFRERGSTCVRLQFSRGRELLFSERDGFISLVIT